MKLDTGMLNEMGRLEWGILRECGDCCGFLCLMLCMSKCMLVLAVMPS